MKMTHLGHLKLFCQKPNWNPKTFSKNFLMITVNQITMILLDVLQLHRSHHLKTCSLSKVFKMMLYAFKRLKIVLLSRKPWKGRPRTCPEIPEYIFESNPRCVDPYSRFSSNWKQTKRRTNFSRYYPARKDQSAVTINWEKY